MDPVTLMFSALGAAMGVGTFVGVVLLVLIALGVI
jgi:hypothetical protein